MRTHEQQREGLLRERDARKAAYVSAVGKRDAIAVHAARPDAIDFDRRELARAEARVEMALASMRDWKDPIPEASKAPPASTIEITSIAPESVRSFPLSGAVDPVGAIVARILASDSTAAGRVAPTSPPPAAVDPLEAIVARILKA